jgi:hypothetical protein
MRYGIVPSKEIFNICGPESAGPAGWDDATVQKRKQAAENYIYRLNLKRQFYEKLEESILQSGFRNPILACIGWLPEARKKFLPPGHTPENTLACDRLGGSRLWIAQKHNLDIPVIISDFNNSYNHLEELKNEADVRAKFMDQPGRVIINTTGLNIGNMSTAYLNELKEKRSMH